MTMILFRGVPVRTVGNLPRPGDTVPPAEVTETDFSTLRIPTGAPISVVSLFPSVDTPACAASTRRFNQIANDLGVEVVCVSADLPFALGRFCGAEGLERVKTASVFRSTLGVDWGAELAEGILDGLLCRAVFVLDAAGVVQYVQVVPEIAIEPDYDDVVAAITTMRAVPRAA